MNSTYILVIVLVLGFFAYNIFSNVPSISSKESMELLSDKNYEFLDVRTESEYASGHIPNSLHIPLQEIQGRISELENIKDKNIIVYCRSGARSSMASKSLIKNGYNVLNLSGGISGWEGEISK
jgi:rhodanese-related sulfurtransferase